MIIWNIYQLVDYATGQVKEYQPGDLVHEILNATTNAAEAARLADLRTRLQNAGTRPALKPLDPVHTVALQLFQPKGETHHVD